MLLVVFHRFVETDRLLLQPNSYTARVSAYRRERMLAYHSLDVDRVSKGTKGFPLHRGEVSNRVLQVTDKCR